MARRFEADDAGDWENEALDLSRETTYEEKVDILGRLLDSESTLYSRKVRDWLTQDDALKVLSRYVTRPAKQASPARSAAPTTDEAGSAQQQQQETPAKEAAAASTFTILPSEEYIISSNRRRDALLASEAEKKEMRELQKQQQQQQSSGDDETPTVEEEEDDDDFAFSKEAKRADKAAEVFVYQVSSLPQDFMDKNLEDIVKEIFDIFDINAEGDFDNFDKMFASFLGPYGTKVFNIFGNNRKLILNLLNYLHEPAISETLIGIIKATLPDQVLISFYTMLNEDGFWETLGQKIYGPGSGSSFEDASAFFNRLVDLCATQSNADVLFSHLSQNMTFIDGLVDCISNRNVSAEQQVAAINALRAILLKSGEQLFDTSLEAYTPTPVPNMLASIHEDLHQHLKTRAGALAQRLIDDAKEPKKKGEEAVFSTYRVGSRFTVPRVHLLEVLTELVLQNPQEVLDAFTPPLWKVLADWLFEHRFNNIYHELFHRIFRSVIKINHVESMKGLMSKNKFITRMIEHYRATNSQDSGLRSYIILMANYVRLTADAQPSAEYLKSFLNSHSQWKEFVPLLKDDTVKQFVTQFPAPAGGHPISLSPFATAETFGLYSSMIPLKPITPEDVDVDLGSEYANTLGFEDTSVYVETKKKRKRKRRVRGKKAADGTDENKGENESEGGEGEGEGEDSEGSDEEEKGDEEAPALEVETPAGEETPDSESASPVLEQETPNESTNGPAGADETKESNVSAVVTKEAATATESSAADNHSSA